MKLIFFGGGIQKLLKQKRNVFEITGKVFVLIMYAKNVNVFDLNVNAAHSKSLVLEF